MTDSVYCFVDTNVWIYSLTEQQDTNKTKMAQEVIQNNDVVISSQVINEACINLLRKFKTLEEQIQQLVESFYVNYRVVELNQAMLITGCKLRRSYNFSFWDSLIVASALQAKCEILFSEDMQHNLLVNDSLRIVNPFL